MRRLLICLFLLKYIFCEEFIIDSTGVKRAHPYDQITPDVIFDDSLFIVTWCTKGQWAGEPNNVSICKLNREGVLVETSAIYITPYVYLPRTISPYLCKGDSISYLIWEKNEYYTWLEGKRIKKGGEVIDSTPIPLCPDKFLWLWSKDMDWNGESFFLSVSGVIIFSNLQFGRVILLKFSTDGIPPSNYLILDQASGDEQLGRDVCIEWGDSVGVVIWDKRISDTIFRIKGVVINREGEILDSLFLNEGEDYTFFGLSYVDSMFLFTAKGGEDLDTLLFQRIDYTGKLIDSVPQVIYFPLAHEPEIVPVNSSFYIFGVHWVYSHPAIACLRMRKDGSLDTIVTSILSPLARPSDYAIGADFDGENFYLSWSDTRDPANPGYPKRSDLYGALVDTFGNAYPFMGRLISYENFLSFNQLYPDVSFLNNKYIVAWIDERKLSKEIYFKIFDENGNPLQEIPYNLTQDSIDEKSVKIINSEKNFLLYWEKENNLYAEIIDSAGVPSGEIIPLCNAYGIQINPSVTYSDSIYFAVWEDQREGGVPKIYGARITVEGCVIDTNGIRISNSTGASLYPKISAIDSIFLVVWEDLRNGNPDIYACRVTKNGDILDPDGIPVCTLVSYQKYPAVGRLGDKFIVTWQDLRNGGDYDLYYARINLNGEVLEPDGNPLISTPYEEISPFIPHSEIPFIMWYRISQNGYEFRGGIIDTNGMLWGERALIPDASFRQHPSLFIKPDSIYFIVYEKRDTNNVFKVYGYMNKFISIPENHYIHTRIANFVITPSITRSKIVFPFLTSLPTQVYIYNQSGRKVGVLLVKGKTLDFNKLNLPAGIYYFKFLPDCIPKKVIYIK